MDLVGICPKGFWPEWIAEGDPAGTVWSGKEWGWYTRHSLARDARPGDRFYIVAHGLLRGYSRVTAVRHSFAGEYVICRAGDAVAVTLPEPVASFRGLRRRWWNRDAEVPFPDWQTAGVVMTPAKRRPGPGSGEIINTGAGSQDVLI